MAGGVSLEQRGFNHQKVHEMNEDNEINELEVELCLEIARQYDEEDLTHPPHRRKKGNE